MGENTVNIREKRIEKKLTMRELSKITNISFSRLSDIEQDRALPSEAERNKLSIVLGEDLLFMDC